MQLHLFPIYQLLWLFFIYAFLGWCTEVAYAALDTGKLVNRGFLNGPLCPIYGCGMAAVLTLLLPLQDNLLILFAGGMLLTTLIELVGGWALKTLFHTTWWDYSTSPSIWAATSAWSSAFCGALAQPSWCGWCIRW